MIVSSGNSGDDGETFQEKLLKSSEKYIKNCTLQETLIIFWRGDEVSDNT